MGYVYIAGGDGKEHAYVIARRGRIAKSSYSRKTLATADE